MATDIDTEIISIKERNTRVEIDKKWETSATRTLTIMTVTYAAAVLLLLMIGADNFWLGALVPVLGYYLSTRSLLGLKQRWVKKYFTAN